MYTWTDNTAEEIIQMELTEEEMLAMYATTVIRVESGTHKLYPCVSGGENLIVGTNTVIGKDGFIVIRQKNIPKIIPSLGEVLIGKNVVIGANCSISRGLNTPTTIGDNTKIGDNVTIGGGTCVGDNVVIDHGCIVGNRCTLKANCYLPFGSVIEDDKIVECDYANI